MLWELVVSLRVNSLLDSWSVVLSLVKSWLDDDGLELLGLSLIEWLPLDWGKGSEVLEGEVELGSSELGVESSIVSQGLAWLVLPQLGDDVVSGKSDGDGEVSLSVESDGLGSGVPGVLLVDILVVENSGSDEWLVRLLSDSSNNTDSVSWSVSSSEEDDLSVSGGGIEGLDVLDLFVTGLGSSHEGDGVQREHLGVDLLAGIPLEVGSWLHVHWVKAELVESVLGADLSGVGHNLSLLLLEWSEDGLGAVLAWEVTELVVEGQSVLSVVVWSQGLGSLLPDHLLALVIHVVWLGDKLKLWHVLLEWHNLTSVGKGVLWSSNSSDDDHLLVDGLEVEVESWG